MDIGTMLFEIDAGTDMPRTVHTSTESFDDIPSDPLQLGDASKVLRLQPSEQKIRGQRRASRFFSGKIVWVGGRASQESNRPIITARPYIFDRRDTASKGPETSFHSHKLDPRLRILFPGSNSISLAFASFFRVLRGRVGTSVGCSHIEALASYFRKMCGCRSLRRKWFFHRQCP